MARADRRIVAAAFVGSLADESGEGDRWSDLDLTFALDDGVSMEELLADWTRNLETELHAIQLFDLPYLSTLYRVFLLPGNLQVDLSFTPGMDFRPFGPKFKLIYGGAGEPKQSSAPSPNHLFGLAVHHLVRARICLERNRLWQSAYWINEARNQVMSLSCLERGLPSSYGRGFDKLPDELAKSLEKTLVGTLNHADMMYAIRGIVDVLTRNTGIVGEAVVRLEPQLRELCEMEKGHGR